MVGEWTDSTVGEVFDLVNGYAFKSADFIERGVPVIKIKNVKAGEFSEHEFSYVSPEFLEKRVDKIAHFGDLLISMSGNRHDGSPETWVGKVAQFRKDGDYFINQRVGALRVKKNTAIDSRFASYVLSSRSYQELFIAIATSSGGQANLSPSQIFGAPFRYPPPHEQLAIAHILGTLDDKIELNRRRNQTLEAMARALFKDWFVDFGPVRAKMEGRDPYLPADLWQLLPDRLDDEGKPEGWETVPASDLIEFNPTEPLRKGTPAPYLDMASLPTSGSWPEPPIMRDFGSGMRFRNGDTLLARITPCLENGKTAFVQCLPDDTVGWGSTEYIVMRPKTPVPAEYAYLLARDDAFREHAIRSMTGTSGRQRAQRDSVAAFKLASPLDENLWHAFARQITPIFDSIKSNAKASETLSALRDTLLPKLISGELRINDAEKLLQHAEDNVPNKKRSLP